jgi:hypothetical protein
MSLLTFQEKQEVPQNIGNKTPDYTGSHVTLPNIFTLTSQPAPGPTRPTDNDSLCGGKTAET